MEAKIIDGKAIAAATEAALAKKVATLKQQHQVTPCLAFILVGDHAASQIYVRNKAKRALAVQMEGLTIPLPASTTQAELLAEIARLNADPLVDGILVQLPLPEPLDSRAVIAAIDPLKDVDGLHPLSAGQLLQQQRGYVSCTPMGCMQLIRSVEPNMAGKHAVVVGRSVMVGRPMAMLLLNADCTVTIAHSKTQDLPSIVAQADILIAAVGQPEMIRGDWIKPGAVVIDVGINRIETADGGARLVGDVAFAEALPRAGAITPVPGGVGPMTIAMLLHNTYLAACYRRNLVPA
jgi:methylenetetrahydrofolate dehydrogenase (NADP+)/methenyltetrahydrofolate cyclohydrolase